MGHLSCRRLILRGHMMAATALVGLYANSACAAPESPAPVGASSQTEPAAGQSGSPISLPAVKVEGQADPVQSMPFDPDQDHSTTGKPQVLTTTTTYATLRDRQIDSLEDYARRVDAAVNYSAGNQSINLRGLDQSRIVTSIDGIRLPWANDGAYSGSYATAQGGVTAFDFNSIGAIDVVKSADSSFFGTGALGGVVAMRTLDPEDILTAGKTFGGLSKATYDSASESALLNQAFAARWGDTLLLLEGGYDNGGQIRNMGSVGGIGPDRTETNPAHYTQGSFLGKLRHYFGNGQRLTLTGEWFDRNYDEQTLTGETSPTDSVRTLSESRRSRVSLNYDYQAQNPTALLSEAHLLGYWQKTETITDGRTYDSADASDPEANFDEHLTLPVQSYGGTGSATFNLVTGPLHHAITLGGEVFLTDTSQAETGFHTDVPPYLAPFIHDNYADMPKIHGTDLGVTLQDRIGVGEGEWLHITPGFRFDYYRRTPQNSQLYMNNQAYELYGLPAASHGTHVSPKVLVEASVVRDLTVYALYSEAYRAPSATELYLDYNSYPEYAVVGNADLKPESSRGWEIGVKYGTAERGLNVNFHDNYYKDFIDSASFDTCPGGVPYAFGCFGYVNLPHVRIYGFEATLNWAFDTHWRGWASLSYNDGRNTDQNYHLASVAPFKGIVGFGYKSESWGGDASTTFSAARHNAKYLTQDGTLSDAWDVPSYALIDLTAWVKPSFFKGLSLRAGVYNLLNKTYYNAAALPYGLSATTLAMAYYSQPGRTAKVTARIEF